MKVGTVVHVDGECQRVEKILHRGSFVEVKRLLMGWNLPRSVKYLRAVATYTGERPCDRCREIIAKLDGDA